MPQRSIVEYFSGGHKGYRCGYCHSTDSCYSHGMWAHVLTPLDYQNLIDRGWRRSGKYCYKPTMNLTCCPLYTIRCEAKKLVLTRSQKKVLKKVHRFLAYGEKSKGNEGASGDKSDQDMEVSFDCPQDIDMQSLKRIKKIKTINNSDIKTDKIETSTDSHNVSTSLSDKCDSSDQATKSSHTVPSSSDTSSSPLKSSNSNSKPPCRKAKEIRKERKLQKLLKKGLSEEEASSSIKPKTNEPKSIEDFLNEPLPLKPAHKLELRLIRSHPKSKEFLSTYDESHKLYVKYQMAIHHDAEEDCDKESYDMFLVESLFEKPEASSSSPEPSYGSYHQQYWLDGKLIAVGVLDILPYCLSSVYFYYDPDYSFLSLGTYAALREIAFTLELNKIYPDLQYYYMGYYIHSCIKMRYKSAFPNYSRLSTPRHTNSDKFSHRRSILECCQSDGMTRITMTTRTKTNSQKLLYSCFISTSRSILMRDRTAAESAEFRKKALRTTCSKSLTMLTVQLSDVESVSEDLRKVTIDATPKWKEIQKLKAGPTPQDHRGSLQVGSVSVLSEDSRRLSLFADAESQLTKMLSVDSADMEEEERKDVRPEEVFTDKARAAMVVIGTKDIKEALDRKKAVEIFRRTPEARSAAIFFQQARFLVHQSRYKEAIVLINKALNVDPERKEWLTEKSLCCFKMLQPELALKHVNEVLTLDPKYFQALVLKGEILYSMWDLERAMLCFVEGRRLRPDSTECIQGIHKIRMALDEISAYRDATQNGKRLKTKHKRSKSAKEKRIPLSPNKSTPESATSTSSRHLFSSKFSQLSDRSSCISSYGDEEVNRPRSQRPVTAHVRRRAYKTTLELRMTSTSEAKTTCETASPHSNRSQMSRPMTASVRQSQLSETVSHQPEKSRKTRPMTAIGKRTKSPTKLSVSKDWLESIAYKLEKDASPSRSEKSNSSFKISSGVTDSSESSKEASRTSLSSSVEDISREVDRKPVRKSKSVRNRLAAKLKAEKAKPVSCIGPKITASLEKDRMFLESILKNKGLRRAKTSYTKKTLRIAKDLHKFVAEREEFWKNREGFIRFAKEEDVFIA
ncbi:Arginyl-tRNA--protein transferase 1 like protein [Argiope bruennichi]|uniref:arginyltransferase n=1 Tax=Argiope bruennichi TaxID=94029 RepID=A0A8T0ES88_ARGBR|nr:Arginyl-tRNA--protein transferase 1 like protein [Argiope bruennichi]